MPSHKKTKNKPKTKTKTKQKKHPPPEKTKQNKNNKQTQDRFIVNPVSFTDYLNSKVPWRIIFALLWNEVPTAKFIIMRFTLDIMTLTSGGLEHAVCIPYRLVWPPHLKKKGMSCNDPEIPLTVRFQYYITGVPLHCH